MFLHSLVCTFFQHKKLIYTKKRKKIKKIVYVLIAVTVGMEVVKIGGPVYRIGLGGGAASSINVQGEDREDLDFGAVQRGDAEMEQKMNRVVRACIEMEEKNPICSIHDQGAGGNGTCNSLIFKVVCCN